MKLSGYIREQRFLLLFYLILMTFISLVFYLDSSNKISFQNIIYINTVALIFFLIYLGGRYFFKKNYYRVIEELISEDNNQLISNLPVPKTYEQQICQRLLKRLYLKQKEIIEEQKLARRENKEFVASWFHQIKTPIAVCRLIIENNSREPSQKVITSLEEEIDKIETQVEQALYYTKIDSFSRDYFIQETNLGRLVNEVIKKYARVFINKKINLELTKIDITIHTDKKWLAFIIEQILSNSLKYTENRGEIRIWVEEKEQELCLIIRDNGVGIKKEDLGRVFDKGFTGYIGRREEKSTGIGLYLAKELARNLGHDLKVESDYGEYTQISICFPHLSDYYQLSR